MTDVSFERHLRLPIVLAKELELAWFGHCTVIDNGASVASLGRPRRTPFLRRNLSYLRERPRRASPFASTTTAPRTINNNNNNNNHGTTPARDGSIVVVAARAIIARRPPSVPRRDNNSTPGTTATDDGDVDVINSSSSSSSTSLSSADNDRPSSSSSSGSSSASDDDDASVAAVPPRALPPRRARSAFALFAANEREAAAARLPPEHRGSRFRLRRAIAEAWNASSSADRAAWEERRRADAERYRTERAAYFGGGGGAAAAAGLRRPRASACHHWTYPRDEDGTVAVRTEEREDRRCPLCFADCVTDEGLVVHLRCTHEGLVFKCGWDKSKRLHVSICASPKSDDGSYSHYERLRPYVFVRRKPSSTDHRRIVDYVQRPPPPPPPPPPQPRQRPSSSSSASDRKRKRPRTSAASDAVADPDVDARDVVPLRQYYHSRTALPVARRDDGDVCPRDSDDDDDDGWRHRTAQELLNEFEDVSDAEKIFMACWNRFVDAHVVVADRSVPRRCIDFTRARGARLRRRGLRQNLLLHLLHLWDSGLVSANHVSTCMGLYDRRFGGRGTTDDDEHGDDDSTTTNGADARA